MTSRDPRAVTLRSGELAKLAGVSTDTLRHYERKGVLTPPHRAANGYRVYPAEALNRVRLIRRAMAIGFTLDELKPVLSARDRGGAPCRKVRSLAAAKLEELEAQIRDLITLRDELRNALHDWDFRLAAAPEGDAVGLLEGLERQLPELEPGSHVRLHRRKSEAAQLKNEGKP